ncbi:MAG TPA: hypothetical protein P5293_08775 [Bacteroidales bacterium]|nr:hypothetical protein [Bacteroidales bacterium]
MSTKDVKKYLVEWIYRQLLFIITLTFIFGVCAGVYGGKMLYEWRMKQATTLKAFVYDKEIYDLKLRP